MYPTQRTIYRTIRGAFWVFNTVVQLSKQINCYHSAKTVGTILCHTRAHYTIHWCNVVVWFHDSTDSARIGNYYFDIDFFKIHILFKYRLRTIMVKPLGFQLGSVFLFFSFSETKKCSQFLFVPIRKNLSPDFP